MSDRPATAQAAPQVRFHLPAPPLRPLVTSYYFVESSGPLEDYTHPEWGNIRFVLRGDARFGDAAGRGMESLPPASIFGSTDRTRRFDSGGGLTLGVGLTPIGWLNLIGRDASRYANRILPLDDALGVKGDMLAEQLAAAPDEAARVALIDWLLQSRVRQGGAYHDAAIRVQAALLDGGIDKAAELAEAMAMEPRTLHRVCRQVFGFAPMRLIRRQRFLRTLVKVRDTLDRPLGQLIDQHYYDQAHFNRDFKAFMGMTPMAYFNGPREVLRRAAVERERVLGARVQALHVPKS